MYGAIGSEDRGAPKRHKPFELKLGTSWKYQDSKRKHMLKSEGQRWRALKVDVRPLNPGEADEAESADEPQSGDDDYADDPDAEAMEIEQGGSSRGGRRSGGPSVFDYTRQQIDPNWAHYGTIQGVVGNARPPTYTDWAESAHTIFDHQTFFSASMERLMKQNYETGATEQNPCLCFQTRNEQSVS
ncbi:hypothetical protein HanRHA438_Chr06g0281371 [Helianthus annuus]|uniref:Uncharacterized protein n=1 Tax=Helianthus annuus TaxID=4232 RepID=A0A9K3NKZ7_HELAN|nr:hypothetical protein HanXRQr2_Chr06g0272371 [Helianthus annuus]KAJ0561463.1 hypothetical protein HanHA300_Chr06g0223201 [Helianthus annuus]KAJ0568114.1 hypothetical protein HanIR_Chr06g0292491 [Helianthus annuus]KAJ0574521.1 hypothetical protein HanHA89_Chr06g0239091 [Helianthus annuus]KAJ0738853.1 hypothetical protein HanLR1_Chr06g0223001 [Helianthus annuus]